MTDQTRSEYYYGNTVQRLGEQVGTTSFAVTPQDFVELTRDPRGNWKLLITDEATLEVQKATIESFVAQNPGVVVGIERNRNAAIGESLPGASVFFRPIDIDEWLTTMYGLLAETR